MELKDLLNVALRIESDGYKQYSKLAEKNTGEMKTLFERLARQEREHQEKFKKIFDKCEKEPEKEVNWPMDENAGYLMEFAEESIFPKLSEDFAPKNINDAIDMAIGVEKDSIIFYNDLKDFFKNKETINDVIAEEKKHLMDLLKNRK